LSFPILLSAVRLYSFTTGAYERAKDGASVDIQHDLQDHWFSDGGITSNFPIHLFDAWLPERPTFGITLYDSPVPAVLTQREPDEAPGTGDGVFLPHPHDFDRSRPPRLRIGGVGDFLRAVFDSAQSHRDIALSGLPSFRERIVQVFLDAREGGLNLAMDRATIVGIEEKGRRAGVELCERYLDSGALSARYQEHLWVRTLTLLSELEKHFAQIRSVAPGQDWKLLATAKYEELIKLQALANPPWYRPQDQVWCREALTRIGHFLELIDQWDKAGGRCFSQHPPRPEGRLRVTSET
jgi:hypothetical protein